MHGQLFAEERFEIAYHVLAAALHAAEELNRLESVTFLQQLAVERQEEIDRSQPDHLISSASSGRRGNLAMFATLAATARAAAGRIRADHAVQKRREFRR